MSTARTELTRRAALHRRWAVPATALACAAALLLPAPPLEHQMIVVAGAVALLGFPHGALDPLVAAVGRRGRGLPWLAGFLGVYLALAGATVALWLTYPGLGLALFLVTSAVHFGLGDVPEATGVSPVRRALGVAAHGAAPILLPAALHPDEVGTIFGWLIGAQGPEVSHWLTVARPVLLGIWGLVLALAYVGKGPAEARAGLIEIVALCAAFALMPPLLSFAVYFCGWHSIRHLIAVDTALGRDARARGGVVALAVMAATGLLLGGAQALAADPASVESVARTVFIALAALTPPHMLVTARLAGSLS